MKMIKIIYVSILIVLAGKVNAQTKEIDLINVKKIYAHENGNRISVKWVTESSAKTNYFEVQRSEDGKNFKTVALVLGPDPKKSEHEFEYVDKVKATTAQKVYYRLCHVNTNGVKQPTRIVELTK